MRKVARRKSFWPKCPHCGRRVGFVYFPGIARADVFCCGCNYRMPDVENLPAYFDRMLFCGRGRA